MVAGTIEKIQVVLQAVTKGFTRSMNSAQNSLKTMNKNVKDFGQVLGMPLDKMKTLNKSFKVMKTTGGQLAFGMRRATHGMRGFRMEMLGVMFFGMMLQRTFSGLIKTSLDWMGVMEVFTLALGILFLPIAGLLLEWALKFLNWVSKLTPEQKKLIGIFVLFGIALGTVLSIIGSFALGIGSLILAFGGGIAKLTGFATGLGGVGTAATGAKTKLGTLGTALKTLAGVAAVAISISLIFSAMKEDDAAKALGKILAGGLAAGIAALLFGVAAPVVIAIGALAVLIGIVIKFNFDPKWRNAVDNFFRGIKERIENWINVIKGFGLFKGIKILRQKEPDAIFRLDQGVAGVSEFELGPRSGRGEAGRIARGEQNIIVNNTNNINVSNSEEMERLLRENNLTLVEEVKKQVGV